MEAWQFGPGPARRARLLVDAGHVGPAVSTAPGAVVVEERADGSVVLELPVTNVGAFRSFVLGVPRARRGARTARAPRRPIVDWLSSIAAGSAAP